MHFSAIVDISWRSASRGHQTSAGWGNKLFSSKMRQYHSPNGADGCCITSIKSLTCLQLVFTPNLSNFRHAFASRGFVKVSWAFLSHLLCGWTEQSYVNTEFESLLHSWARLFIVTSLARATCNISFMGDTVAAVPPPFRPVKPALCGSYPLVIGHPILV